MLEDRFYEIIRQNFPIRILTHATYQAKQTLAAKGITPAVFLSPFYMKKGDYSMEVCYGQKQKNYKPLPQVCPIDYDQYQNKQLDQTTNRVIRQTVAESQFKTPKDITSQTFKHRQSIQKYLNNLNFHWFQNSVKNFYHGLFLNESNFKRSTLQQPKGMAFIIQVNDRSLKQNFEKIKKQADVLIKRMYYLNPNHVKSLPILVVVMFDPNKSYSYKDVKSYTDSLKSDYGIESVLTAKIQINGPSMVDSSIWSNYTRPIFNFVYKITPSDPIRFLSEEGSKSLSDAVNIHRERVKKLIQKRLQVLFKKYDEYYSMGSKLFGFFKGNSTPKEKYLVSQEAEAREIADLMFILEDYKKAHDVYKNIIKDFEKRQFSIEMDLRYMISMCYQMGKFVGMKVNSTSPKQFLEKQAQQFQLYQKQGRKQLTKFLILFLYMLHTFKIFDPILIKDRFLYFIKRAMNMTDDRRNDQHKHGHKMHFLLPTLLYEQYSNINLLYIYIDYRRYCYDTVRVSMKYAEYRLFTHALRCLLLVEGVYVGAIASMEKYIAVHLSSDYVQNKNFQESLNSIKKAWKIMADNTTFYDNYMQTEAIQFKKMLSNHGKIISQIQRLSPQILNVPDNTNLVIPYVVQTDVRLTGEEQIQQKDRTGISWTQISEYLNQNTQLYSQGYNKDAMQKIFKLYDCTYSQQKQLIYRVNCSNLTQAIINRNARISHIKQPIRLCFTFLNPYIQEIAISDFKVLIKDSYKNFEVIQNPYNKNLVIKPRKKVNIFFQVIPNETGLLEFQGLQWTFQKMRTKYTFRQIRNIQSNLKPFYHIIKIVQPKGKLKVYENPQQQLFQGQSIQNKVFLQNCGQKTIQSIYIAFGCDQFYGKKYQKLRITIKPQQKIQIKFNLHLPGVPQNIKKDWKLMDKKIFLYRTEGQFRVHRSSILTLINKILFYKVICEKLSTHLHLLTFTHDKSHHKKAQLQSMIIKSGFQISKTDNTQFQNTQTYYFFLSKNKKANFEVFNFQTESSRQEVNSLTMNAERLRNLPQNKNEESIDLVFGWRAQGKRSGLIDIQSLNITPLKEQVLPFTFSTTMPFIIRHNFGSEPVLQTNFQIKIKNIFHYKQVGVNIKLLHDNTNGIYWEGISQIYHRLKHDEGVSLQVCLVISKPGVYDISDCLKYKVEIDRQNVDIKHSEHQRLFIHVVDDSMSYSQRMTSAIAASSMISSVQNINLSTSSLMFSARPFDKKQQVLLLEQQDSKLISSPRFSKVLQNQLLVKNQQEQKDQKQDNLIDLL